MTLGMGNIAVATGRDEETVQVPFCANCRMHLTSVLLLQSASITLT